MEIQITEFRSNITEKVQSIRDYKGFTEYESHPSDITVWVYAPERGGDFTISFTICWKSEKPKKRRKQLLRLLCDYLNTEEITWMP